MAVVRQSETPGIATERELFFASSGGLSTDLQRVPLLRSGRKLQVFSLIFVFITSYELLTEGSKKPKYDTNIRKTLKLQTMSCGTVCTQFAGRTRRRSLL